MARPTRQPAGKRKVHLQSSNSSNTKVEYRRVDLNLRKGDLIISTVIHYPFTFNFSVSYVLAVCYAYSGIWIVVTFVQSWSFLTVKFEIFTFIMITYLGLSLPSSFSYLYYYCTFQLLYFLSSSFWIKLFHISFSLY